MLYIVAALSDNNIIGVNGKLPWRLKNELKWFRMNTLHGAVIMGRKTWDSLPKKPLHGRLNIILTRGMLPPNKPNIIWKNHLRDAIVEAYHHAKRVYIIGGSDIFEMAIQYKCKLLITRVHYNVKSKNNTREMLLPEHKKLIWRSKEQREKSLTYHFELYIT